MRISDWSSDVCSSDLSLNKFVVWMALPSLLFQAMAKITWDQVKQPGFVAASTLAIAAVFLVSYFLDRRRSGRLADASIEGLAASYSNAGFMGIPLCLMLFGEASQIGRASCRESVCQYV